MPRVKRGTVRKNRRKKILDLAKGYWGVKGSGHRIAKEQVEKGLDYAFRDRKARKREFRGLWIVRINAAARLHDLSYSRLVSGLKKAGADIDRKALAAIAVADPAAFGALAERAKSALAKS